MYVQFIKICRCFKICKATFTKAHRNKESIILTSHGIIFNLIPCVIYNAIHGHIVSELITHWCIFCNFFFVLIKKYFLSESRKYSPSIPIIHYLILSTKIHITIPWKLSPPSIVNLDLPIYCLNVQKQ